MSKFTLKTASLLCMVLFSVSSWAQPPWAEEEGDAATEALPDAMPEMMPEALDEGDENGRPAAMDDAMPADDATDASETVVVTEQTGDVMKMREVPMEQSQQAEAIGVRILEFPRRGMSTLKVENELGRPTEIIPAVGQPPISRWVYDDRIVYFERSSVIHVVAK